MRATAVPRRLWAFLALFLCLHVVLAGVARPLPRQEDEFSTTELASPGSTPAVSTTAEGDASRPASASITSATAVESISASSTTKSSTDSATSSIISATPFVFNGTAIQNSTKPGELPLQPERSPGFYVAATVLIVTGVTYSLFANKNHLVYCFFSTAFSVALGITLIILLLIRGELSNSLQGGLVAVVIISGSIVGGCSTLKPIACEPLSCLLGGFCFAMWILTLKESALLGQEPTKNGIFLSAFSVCGLVLYFPRTTKFYFMMAASAFTGATAVILGIDFVSNAGLKEYWAWIWNLNEDLFPPDADAYPLKMGIKIEQGVTIVLFLFGIMVQWSQMKTVRRKRAQQELESRQGELAVRRADEKAGMAFVKKIASEREAFEARVAGPQGTAYESRGSRMDNFLSPLKKGWKSFRTKDVKGPGDSNRAESVPRGVDDGKAFQDRGTYQTHTDVYAHIRHGNQSRTSVHTRHDSCNTDKKYRDSGTTITRISTAHGQQDIEMDEIRPASPLKSSTPNKQINAVEEVGPATPPKTTVAMVMSKDEDAGRTTVQVAVDEVELAAATAATRNPSPEVVPLPFKIPTASAAEREGEYDDDDDHSSLAVITDGYPDNEALETRSIDSKRSPFAKRLSTGSADLFRRLSQHSMSRHLAKTDANGIGSTENLNAARHGDRDSIAATFDDMSSVDENDLPAATSPTEIMAELGDSPTDATLQTSEKANEAIASGDSLVSQSGMPTNMKRGEREGDETEVDNACRKGTESSQQEEAKRPKTAATDSELGSGPGVSEVSKNNASPQTLKTSLLLDARVSQAVQTYRMVDWVKNQTKAEQPQSDNLDIPELSDSTQPRRVDVSDLLQTAETGAVRLAMPRTASAIQARAQARLSSAQQHHSTRRPSNRPENARNISMSSEQRRQAEIQATAAALAGGAVPRTASNPSEATTTAESLRSRPPVPGIKSYNTPQSLVAKRETMVRMKEQALRPHSVQPSPAVTPGVGGTSAQDFGQAHGSVAALGPGSQRSAPDSTPSSRRTSYRAPDVSDLQLDDVDEDMPMRQRQAVIRSRRSSMEDGSPPSSGHGEGSESPQSRRSTLGFPAAGGASGSSLALHNPRMPPHTQRNSFNNQKRESQLALFRSSVQADMRASAQGLPVTTAVQQPGYGGGYRPNIMTPVNGPLINNVYNAIPGTSSSNSLLPQQTQVWQAEISRDLDARRQSMLAQKNAENTRKEKRRAERQRQSQLREQHSATGDMHEAHSEMMFRLQKKANIQ